MAKNAMFTEVFVLISCGLYLASNGQRCTSTTGDVGTLVGQSPIVLEGRVEETRPSAFQPADSGLFDAVVSVATLFKGQLDGGSQERIVVGPFGESESTEICVGGTRSVGDELILFLNASGYTSAEVGALRHFRLAANPVVADTESRRTAEEHATQRNPHAIVCPENDYCLNGGTCYLIPALGRRFCQCTAEYQDIRCMEKQTGIGESKHREENLVKEYFFLIIIGSAAVFLVLVAACILLVIFVRCKSPTTKVKYSNVNTDPERAVEDNSREKRTQNFSRQSSIGVQTDSTNGVSAPRSNYRTNGSGKSRTNGAKSGDNAELHRPPKPQDVREPGSHLGRTGQNVPLKTGEPLPVPRVPTESSRNGRVASGPFRGRDLQKYDDPIETNYPVNGVWMSRPSPDERSPTQRGQRLDGVSVSRDYDLDSTPV